MPNANVNDADDSMAREPTYPMGGLEFSNG